MIKIKWAVSDLVVGHFDICTGHFGPGLRATLGHGPFWSVPKCNIQVLNDLHTNILWTRAHPTVERTDGKGQTQLPSAEARHHLSDTDICNSERRNTVELVILAAS